MSGQRCPGCGGYIWVDGICQSCGYSPKAKPKFEFEKVDVFKLAKGLKAKEEANANKSGETQSPPKQIAASTREVAMSEILKNAGRHFVDINGHYEVVVDGDMVTINTIHDESGRVVAKAMFDGSEWGRIVAWVEWAKHDWNTQSEGRS